MTQTLWLWSLMEHTCIVCVPCLTLTPVYGYVIYPSACALSMYRNSNVPRAMFLKYGDSYWNLLRNHNALMSESWFYSETPTKFFLCQSVPRYRCSGRAGTAVHAMFLCEKHRYIALHRGSCAMYLCFDMHWLMVHWLRYIAPMYLYTLLLFIMMNVWWMCIFVFS